MCSSDAEDSALPEEAQNSPAGEAAMDVNGADANEANETDTAVESSTEGTDTAKHSSSIEQDIKDFIDAIKRGDIPNPDQKD